MKRGALDSFKDFKNSSHVHAIEIITANEMKL